MKRAGISTIVFNDISTACLWLGIDAAKAHHIIQKLLERHSEEDDSIKV